jgi:hypothetical protein
VTRSKEKGTAAETLVVRYLRKTYWPHAERRALSGGEDKGDITGTPGLAWEVKAAKTICVPAWLRETEAERENAKADYAVLVIKPVGVGATRVGEWYALMDRERFMNLTGLTSVSGNAPLGWIEDRWSFETSIRKTKLPHAALTLGLRSEEFAWAQYPNFTFMSLAQMTRLLLLAGYGSNVVSV